jgi:hypothetical protein
MDANVLSGLVKAHAKGQNGLFGTIKDTKNGIKQSKGSLVILHTMHLNTRMVNEFHIVIINGII